MPHYSEFDYDGTFERRRAEAFEKYLEEKRLNKLYGFDGAIMEVTASKSGISSKMALVSVYFVNGIRNQFTEALESAQIISSELNASITLVYSKTEGPLDDIENAHYIVRTGALTQAAQVLRNNISKDIESGKKVIFIGHSRGAAIAWSVVRQLRRLSLKGNLTILTLGGFCIRAENWETDADVISYVNVSKKTGKKDFIPAYMHNKQDRFTWVVNPVCQYKSCWQSSKTPPTLWDDIKQLPTAFTMHGVEKYKNAVKNFALIYPYHGRTKITKHNYVD